MLIMSPKGAGGKLFCNSEHKKLHIWVSRVAFLFCIVVKTTVASSIVIKYVIMPSVYLINAKYRHL